MSGGEERSHCPTHDVGKFSWSLLLVRFRARAEKFSHLFQSLDFLVLFGQAKRTMKNGQFQISIILGLCKFKPLLFLMPKAHTPKISLFLSHKPTHFAWKVIFTLAFDAHAPHCPAINRTCWYTYTLDRQSSALEEMSLRISCERRGRKITLSNAWCWEVLMKFAVSEISCESREI